MKSAEKNKLLESLWVFCANMLHVYTVKKTSMSEDDYDKLIDCLEQNRTKYVEAGLEKIYSEEVNLLLDRIQETWREKNEPTRT